MCLHGIVRSGHVHDGLVDKVTVYTFPVAPSTKKLGPERSSRRRWWCKARTRRSVKRECDRSLGLWWYVDELEATDSIWGKNGRCEMFIRVMIF